MEMPPDRSRERIRRRRRAAILLAFVGVVLALLYLYRAVLAPFLVALFVAYLISPLVERLAPIRLGGRFRVGRGGAIVLLYVVFLVALYLGGSFAVPAMGRQLRQAREDLPHLQVAVEAKAEKLLRQWTEWTENARNGGEEGGAGPAAAEAEEAANGEEAEAEPLLPPLPPDQRGPPRVRFHLQGGGAIEGAVIARSDDQAVVELGGRFETIELGRVEREERLDTLPEGVGSVRKMIRDGVQDVVGGLDQVLGLALRFVIVLVGTVYEMVLIMMITAFLVIDQQRILSFLKRVPPVRYHNTVNKLAGYIDRGLAGVIRGQLMICAVNGLLTWIGLEVLGVRYAGLLGLIAGIFSLIPIFGTILSTIPIVLVAWGTGSVEKGVLALGWILLIHFAEANLLNPKIMGSASKIHPVVVIFALLAGEHAYGLVGALLAVPTVSILQSSFKFYVLDRQAEGDDGDGEPAPAGA